MLATAYSQNQKLLPRDETDKEASLRIFVDELKNAVKKQDGKYILSVLDKEVISSFGGDGGIGEFKQLWDIQSPNSEVWRIMEKILDLGGVFMQTDDSMHQFVFPYVFALELDNDDDYYTVEVVVEDKLTVRERPDDNSNSTGILSYDVVWVEYSEDFKPQYQKEGWTYVRTLDKKIIGYVPSDALYSPIGYRMILAKTDNNWKITCLVAGD